MKVWIACGVLLAGSLGAHQVLAADVACSLLAASQVSQVLGVAVGDGQAMGAKLCQWVQTGKPDPAGTKKVTLTIMDAQGFQMRITPIQDPKITKTPVSGIGDQANFGTTGGKMGSLAVKKEDHYFAVQVWGFPVGELEAMEKTLASEILGKL